MIPVDQITAKHVIFDLDGTLIDSAPAILYSFAKAFSVCGCTPAVPLSPSLIGPPLMKTLALLAGTHDPSVLNPLAEAFKTYYDDAGYRDTKAFPGVTESLISLMRRRASLYLATNKRIIPTKKIIDYLGWDNYFVKLYALDSYEPPLKTKAELLGYIIRENNLILSETTYIGDRNEDRAAAVANNISYEMVGWGYIEGGLTAE
jgi:phosphoglycolate phosphatase